MKIKMVFESTEEMMEFCQAMAGTEAPALATGTGKREQSVTTPASINPTAQQTAPAGSAPVTAPAQATSVPVQTAPVQPVPTTQQPYTLDDLASAAMTLMDAGRMADLQQLLASFGVEALPALPQARYGEFATALRGMGAQI